jgi:hypothetical protein
MPASQKIVVCRVARSVLSRWLRRAASTTKATVSLQASRVEECVSTFDIFRRRPLAGVEIWSLLVAEETDPCRDPARDRGPELCARASREKRLSIRRESAHSIDDSNQGGYLSVGRLNALRDPYLGVRLSLDYCLKPPIHSLKPPLGWLPNSFRVCPVRSGPVRSSASTSSRTRGEPPRPRPEENRPQLAGRLLSPRAIRSCQASPHEAREPR